MAEENEISVPKPRRFLDLALFFKTLDTLGKLPGNEKLDPVAQRLSLAYMDELLTLSEAYVDPLLALHGFQSLKPQWVRLKQPKRTDLAFRKRGSFIASLYGAARTRKAGALRDLFTGPDLVTAQRFAAVGIAAKGDLKEELQSLADVHVLGGSTRTKSYVRSSLEAAGVQFNDFTEAMSEVTEAKEIGTKLRSIETLRNNTDPNDLDRQADLAAESDRLQDEVQDLAYNSAHPAAVTDAAISEAAKATASGHGTAIGAQLGLSPPQEDAMIVRGKSVIGAGAGSGKTRVLAGKVVYHIKELGVSPNQIIATSFSKKSAYELTERIRAYGGEGVLPHGAPDGFGTTHSVSGKLLDRFANRGYGVAPVLEDGPHTSLIKQAMAQVMMRPRSSTGEHDPNESFFTQAVTQAAGSQAQDQQQEPIPSGNDPEEIDPGGVTWEQALEQARSFHRENPYVPYARLAEGLSGDLLRKGRQPQDLSYKEQFAINKAFERSGVRFRASADGLVQSQPAVSATATSPTGGQAVSAAGRSPYWQEPANQWFNLGDENAWADAKGRPIGHKTVGTEISKWKGSLVTPGQAYGKGGGVFAAAYAAYEWLKKMDVSLPSHRDHDDVLIETSQMMISKPAVLKQIQSQYKFVLVDECLPYRTPVLLADGSSMEIGKIVDGKLPVDVLSYDIATGTQRACRVTGWQKLLNQKPLVKVTVQWQQRKGTHRPTNFVVCTTDHKILVGNETWVEAGSLVPGDQVQVETAAEKSQAYKITTKGRSVLSQEMGQKNALGITGKAARGGSISVRGGNGTGLTIPQQVVLDRLGGSWEAEVAIPTKIKRGSGYPTCYKVDIAHLPSKTAVEIDGHSHNNQRQRQLDRKKEDFLSSQGWKVLRFSNKTAIQSLPDVIDTIERTSGTSVSCGTEDGCPTAAAVLSVEPVTIPDNYVYDVTVEDCHNFYANGILVHNCQDLNPAQHLLFGLLSGYYDPMTQKPKPDGSITADTYCLIGDDKQAIFEFRGANPEMFINLSTEQGFDTKLLEMNYRSGHAIVDAANKLIAHNKKQIPMVCESSPDRGVGSVSAVSVATHEAGAALAASEIAAMLEDKESGFAASDFGVGARTKAELFAYCTQLLIRGVPFKCPKVKMFGDHTSKALIHWLRLSVVDPNDKSAINEIVLEAHGAPGFGLDAQFGRRLQSAARGQNYLTFLEGGGWRNVYDQDWRNKKGVLPYTEALTTVRQLKGTPSEILTMILSLRGSSVVASKPALSILEALTEAAKKDPEIMDQLTEESGPGGQNEVTDDQVRELALAPIAPLMGLLESYDDLDAAMRYIGKLQEANKKTQKKAEPSKANEKDAEYEADAVVLDTVHGWKGLEAKHMFVPMANNVFPHIKSMGSEESMASERRLAYVAITRGRDSVKIICPDETHGGKPGGVSQFVHEGCVPVSGGTKASPQEPVPETAVEAQVQDERIVWEDIKAERDADRALKAAASAADFAHLVIESLPKRIR